MNIKKLSVKEIIMVTSQLILGLVVIGAGIFIVVQPNIFWKYVSYFSLVITGVIGLLFLYLSISKKNIGDFFAFIGAGILFVLILINETTIASLIALFFGIWALINAAAHFLLVYIAYRKGERFPLLNTLFSIVETVFGIVLLVSYLHSDFGIVVWEISFYIMLVGLIQVTSGIRVLIRNKSMLHLPAPVFVSALLPSFEVRRINRIKKINPKIITEEILPTTGNKVSIYIYSNVKGFDTMGHMGIGYKGKIYNYGNHDPYNRSKTMIFGDGVMIVGDEVDHVSFAIDTGNTLFRFVCELSPTQQDHIEKQFEKLFMDAYVYEYPSFKDPDKKHYLSWVEDYGCVSKYYKFSKGKFKTYSVLRTNCVLITDYIFQTTGMKFFQISGIISPGAYYDYLNGVLNKPGSIVKERYIYQR